MKIKPRVRLVIIKDNNLLVTYNSKENFYFYIGGKVEFGETIEQACQREVTEECGAGIHFVFKKILYVRDYVKGPDEHSIEFYILGDLDNFSGIDGRKDPEYPDSHSQSWLNLDNIPKNLLPTELTKILLEDYNKGFPRQGIYLGNMD